MLSIRPWIALALIPLLATCGGEVVGVGEIIQSIDVTPANPELSALGYTQQFRATARGPDGRILSGKRFTWSSSAPGVATIDPETGLATAEGNGTARITATAEGISGFVNLGVSQTVREIAVSSGQANLTAIGAVTTLGVTAVDAGGSQVGNLTVDWTSSDSSVVSVSASGVATAVGNGSATIAASVNGVSGTFELSVTQITTQLAFLTPPPPNAVSGVVFGQQPSIQLQDANGHPVLEPGVQITVSVASGSGTLAGPTAATTTAAGTATFSGLAISGIGIHTLSFAADGVPPLLSNAISLGGAATDPGQSVATIAANITAGNPSLITIHARDASGNPVGTGGDVVTVDVTGANSSAPSVVDNGNGIYSAVYTPTLAGTDVITVTINGAAIAGSPFTSIIAPSVLNATNSTAIVPNGIAGVPTVISVQARDVYGNALLTGGAVVSVTVTGANPLNRAAVDHGDGTYSATYTPVNNGNDTITISMNGSALEDSPFTSVVAIGAADPTQSSATVPVSTTAGTSTTVTIITRDASGNDLTSGDQAVSVAVTGPNASTLSVTDLGNGTYTANYTPTAAGTDNIVVTLNGAALGGSPYSTVVQPAAVDPGQSSGNIPATGTATVATPIIVVARDAFGNQRTTGGESVAVVVSGANSVSPPVTDEGTGTYTTSYTPMAAGFDNVAVTINGSPIAGSPFVTEILAGGPDPSQSTATVAALVTAGTLSTIQVAARDVAGNPLTTGGALVTVDVTGSNAESLTVVDNSDGTYTASYTPTVAGLDGLTISMNGTPIGGGPYGTTITPGILDPTVSSATVSAALVAGSSNDITIVARDEHGNQLSAGGESVTVQVSGNNPVTPPVTDHGDGTYSASYAPTVAGMDNVTITLSGIAISGSPYTTIVSSGPADASQSGASLPTTSAAGATVDILITVRDEYANALAVGGDVVTIGVTGSNADSPVVTDNGDGTYSASYVPTTAGSDNVAVAVNGAPISGSPITVTIDPATVSGATSTATVPGTGTSNAVTEIVVQARDAFGNAVTQGGATVTIVISGTNAGSPSVTDVGDGTYTASYTPTAAGNDNVVIELNGVAISGSPFTSIVAAGDPDASNTTADVPPSITAGNPVDITIQARDTNGNPVTSGGATVVVSITGANSSNPSVIDHGDGTYTSSYTPTLAGTDNIAIALNGNPINGSPFTRDVVPGAVDPTQSTAAVPSSGTAGVATNIVVQARDANGNAVTVGGATVVVSISGDNSATPTVTDEGDGTYAASYTPTAAGTDNVAITINGQGINGSPFASTVLPGAVDPAQSTAVVPGSGNVGTGSNIVVQGRDANGNALTAGGATVVVSVSGDNSATPVVTDEGDGTYTASYTPTATGVDTITITLNGSPISGSPFTSTVSSGTPVANQTTATVPTTGTAGATTDITVQARDAEGNPVLTGGATVVVTVSGANPATPAVTDESDGTYTASYTPTTVGSDNIVITLNGGAIGGSPFASTISAGPLDPAQSTASVPTAGAVGVASAIIVQARDTHGNALTGGGATVFVSVTGANTETPTVTDEGDGTYTTSYTPTAQGADNIAITLNGVAISGSPFSSTISLDTNSDPVNTFAIVPNGTPGDVTTLTVRTRDSNDSNVTTGGAAIAISVTGTNSASPPVTDNGDGTYTASYTPSLAGSDAIAITLNGTPIEGSPYTSTVSVVTALTGKIAYERLPSPSDENADVIVMNDDGTGMVNLTNNLNFSDERPGISPDGTKIVFNSDRDGDMNIWVMNSNGSNPIQLTTAVGRDRLPVWSPDGTKILFLSERDGDSDIWVMNADGTGETPLTSNSVDDYQADWSPDGTQIAFYASDNGDFEVFTMNADGSNRTEVIDLPASREVEVSWGLGGIAFISDMDTGGFPNPTQIYKIQPDGTGLTRLTNNSSWDYMPEWSADGTRIVFITARDGNGGEIYVMNADGTNQTRLTTDSGAEWAPKFQY